MDNGEPDNTPQEERLRLHRQSLVEEIATIDKTLEALKAMPELGKLVAKIPLE